MNENSRYNTPNNDLAHFVAAVWSRKWLVVLTTFVGIGVGVVAGTLIWIGGQDSEGSGTHEATGSSIIFNPLVLPENEQLESIDIGSVFARSGISHQIGISSSAVLRRAVLKMRPDLDPETDSVTITALVNQLDANFTAEATAGTNLVQLTLLADGEALAAAQLEAITTAYQEFLDEELDEQRQSALQAIQERIDQIQGSAPVSASVLSQLSRASLELATIDTAVSEQVTELESIEQAAVEFIRGDTTGISALEDLSPEEEEALEELLSAAAAISSASDRLTNFTETHSENVSAAVVALQVEDLRETSAELSRASIRMLGLFDEFAIEGSLSALESDLDSYQNALQALNQTVSLLEVIDSGTPVIGAPIANLLTIIEGITSDLQDRVDTTTVSVVTVERDRDAVSAEAVAASASLSVIADEIQALLLGEGPIEVSDLGRLSAAQDRLNAAARELQSVESVELIQGLNASTNLVQSSGSQIGAVAQTLGSTATQITVELESGVVSSSSTDVVGQVVRASNTSLSRISELLVTLRQGVTGGGLFSELIAIDSIVDQSSVTLNAIRLQSDDAALALASLRTAERNLSAELSAIEQAIQQAITRKNSGVEISRREFVVQIQSAASSLRDADEGLANVRRRSLPGTDLVSLVNLSAQINSGASDLGVLAELINAIGNAAAIDTSVTDALVLLQSVDSSTPDSTARAVIVESDVRLNASGALLDQLAGRLRSVVEDNEVQDEVGITLSAQRLSDASDRLLVVADLLSDIERPSDAEFGDLLTLQEEVDAVIAANERYTVSTPAPQVSQVSRLGLARLAEDIAAPAAIAGVAGILVGLLAVFATDYMDRGVRTVNELVSVTGIQPIGAVAAANTKDNANGPELTDESSTMFADSIQLLATEIDQLVQEAAGTMLIASARAGDGKTTLSLNAARVLAQRGKRVLIVDANLRKPDLSRILELEGNAGLADALEFGTDPAGEIVEQDQLHVLPAGRSSMPAIDALSRASFGAFIRDARESYEVVIVDGPPAIGFADALIAARHAQSVVMVARANRTTSDELMEACEAIQRTGAEVHGTVLNMAGPENFSYVVSSGSYGAGSNASNGVGARLKRLLRLGGSEDAAA